jgi:glycosyltransferase involved in cell wall biosynthesis
MNQLISVIVTTYNWPCALSNSIHSLTYQDDKNFEIIIADDGSTPETLMLINELSKNSSIVIQHVFQDNLGFRAGTIRNKATAASKGDYLIFLDGATVSFDLISLAGIVNLQKKAFGFQEIEFY